MYGHQMASQRSVLELDDADHGIRSKRARYKIGVQNVEVLALEAIGGLVGLGPGAVRVVSVSVLFWRLDFREYITRKHPRRSEAVHLACGPHLIEPNFELDVSRQLSHAVWRKTGLGL